VGEGPSVRTDPVRSLKAVEDDLRVRRRLRDGRDVRLRHVDRDRLDERAPLRAELLEEGPKRVGVLPLSRPDHAPGDVVDHDGHILVVFPAGELVDADVREPVEDVVGKPPLDHATDDRADRRPRDAHHRRDDGLRGRPSAVGVPSPIARCPSCAGVVRNAAGARTRSRRRASTKHFGEPDLGQARQRRDSREYFQEGLDSGVAQQAPILDLFSWFQKELQPGGVLHTYLWPVWRKKRAIRFPTETGCDAKLAAEM
jgi:hypothetical protein